MSREQLSQLTGRFAQGVIIAEVSARMTQRFAHQAAHQMPQITGLDPFDLIAARRAGRRPSQCGTPCFSGSSYAPDPDPGWLCARREQTDDIGGPRIGQETRPPVAIPNKVASGVSGEGCGDVGLGHVRREGP